MKSRKQECAAALLHDQLVDGETDIREAWRTIDAMACRQDRAYHEQTVRLVLACLLEEAYKRDPVAPPVSFGRRYVA